MKAMLKMLFWNWRVLLLTVITYLVIGWWVVVWVAVAVLFVWAYLKSQEGKRDDSHMDWL